MRPATRWGALTDSRRVSESTRWSGKGQVSRAQNRKLGTGRRGRHRGGAVKGHRESTGCDGLR